MKSLPFQFYYGPKIRQVWQNGSFTLEGFATNDEGTAVPLPSWLYPFILADAKMATRHRTDGNLPLDPYALDTFYYKQDQNFVFIGKTRFSRPTPAEIDQYRRENIATTEEETDSDNYAALFRQQAFKRLVPHPKSGLAQVALAFVHKSRTGTAWLLDEGTEFRPWIACTPQKQLLIRLVKQMKKGGTQSVIHPIRRFMKVPKTNGAETAMLRIAMVTYTDANPDTTLLNLFLAHFAA